MRICIKENELNKTLLYQSWCDEKKALEMGYKIPECLEDFIDFEAYGKYCGEYVKEYSDGLIEIFY